MTNAGAIGGGVYLGTVGGGTVTNQSGATITNGATAVLGAVVIGSYNFGNVIRGGGGTVTNAGAIVGTGTFIGGPYRGTDGVVITTGNVINLSGAIITSAAANGVYIIGSGASSVTNQAGGTITGATNGVSTSIAAGDSTVTNAGAITGTAASGIYLQNGGSVSVTNQAGGTITGGVNGVQFKGGAAFLIVTVTNAGTITGTSGAGVSLGTGGGNGIKSANITNLPARRSAAPRASTSTTVRARDDDQCGHHHRDRRHRDHIAGRGLQHPDLADRLGAQWHRDRHRRRGLRSRLVLQGTGTANNNFQQFAILEVDASGIWALNGVFTTTSPESAVINSGTLVIGDGSHPGAQFPGAVTVNAGATLGGQGTVGGINGGIAVAPGGTVAPGVVSPFSTLNDTGNVQFDVGSFFNVNVNAAGQNDKLAVGGTATLTGGIVQVAGAAGQLRRVDQLHHPDRGHPQQHHFRRRHL